MSTPRSNTPVQSAGSPARSASGSSGRPAEVAPADKATNTRMELPPDAYVSATSKSMFALRGNKLNTEGRETDIQVNQYRMKRFDFNKKIYQYDIAISPDTRKVPFKKIMTHPTVKAKLAPHNYPMWIFDGKKLAWAPVKVPEMRFQVDLDAERRDPNAPPRQGGVFHVIIRQTTEINIASLQGYLDQRIQFNNVVQEALNFLDHLLRQGPSMRLLSLRRNFYDQNQRGAPLEDGRVVEVHKGLYASIRMSHNKAFGGIGLALNADVANTAFWVGNQPLDKLMFAFLAQCDSRWRNKDPNKIADELRPVKRPDGRWESSDAFKHLRKLRRLKFTVKHRNRKEGAADKIHSVADFLFEAERYGKDGATARTVKFEHEGKMTSVNEYYRDKYDVYLKHANLPLIDAGKGGAIPMELAIVEPMQRYNFKLNPDQTAAMIKIAVTRPPIRRRAIEEKVRMLQLPSDSFMRQYGVEFDQNFTTTKARVIQPPIVKFAAKGSQKPNFSGRWNINNLKFWTPNARPLEAWGIVAMENCADGPVLQTFVQMFKQTYQKHGGIVTKDAIVIDSWKPANRGEQDPTQAGKQAAEVVRRAHERITRERGYTQLLFIVVSKKNSPYYERLKKSADCRFGILSQVVQRGHIVSNNAQYHSNVCMKVNAKLGGATARTDPPWRTNEPTYFPKARPTMMVGVDISHAAPGGNTASIAAMTMNADANAIRYNAACETNGYRTEIITPKNVQKLFGKLAEYWGQVHRVNPSHLIYFRDGVGEGQFAQVLAEEVEGIRRWFRGRNKPPPKMTVIIATKRHHIRFFPGQGGGDKNGNPLPGTLVEKEVTHPFMFDFYLNSHVAIQGTARPVHYYVLLDEMGMPVNELQKMIYHQCYSYVRSTTPVSLHPAVYYAHLAGSRARCHENVPSGDIPRHGGAGHEQLVDRIAKGQHVGPKAEDLKGVEAPPLIELGGLPVVPDPERMSKLDPKSIPQRQFINRTMWHV